MGKLTIEYALIVIALLLAIWVVVDVANSATIYVEPDGEVCLLYYDCQWV